MTRIRQVAPLLHIINFNNLCFRVENETTLISAKNRVYLSSISEVRSYITEWPRFSAHPVEFETANVKTFCSFQSRLIVSVQVHG